jgi:hypothetical protein
VRSSPKRCLLFSRPENLGRLWVGGHGVSLFIYLLDVEQANHAAHARLAAGGTIQALSRTSIS